jgi:putative transposase
MLDAGHFLSLRGQCALLSISRSHHYYCPKENALESELMNCIHEIHQRYPALGYRKIHWHLRVEDGYAINRKRVQRLMQKMGIQALYCKPRTSIPSREGSVFPYLLCGLAIVRPNQVWSIDITYIKLPVGTVYLFALIDWYSRYIVAHILVNTMEACHGITVLEMALCKAVAEICNADQGSQFTCPLWISRLQEAGIKISHDGVGRCIDNVRIERFWRTIKYEDVFLRSYDNLVEARKGIGEFIEYYNHQRPHQALDYARPAEVYFGGSSPPPPRLSALPH